MTRQTLTYWISAAFTALCGIIITVGGIHLLTRECASYADLGCAFGVIFGMIVAPYGVIVLLLAGLTSISIKSIRLIGSISSILTGVFHFGLCCITVMWAFSDGPELVSNTELAYFLFPLFFLLTGISMLGMGVLGYQKANQ